MHQSHSVSLMFVLSLFSGLIACGSEPPTTPSARSASAESIDDIQAYLVMPAGSGASRGRHFSFRRSDATGAARAACTEYDVDVTVEFGEITGSMMEVRSVGVTYRVPDNGSPVPPFVTPLPISSLYSKTVNTRLDSELLAHKTSGETSYYPIDRRYDVDTNGHNLTLQFASIAGSPGADTSDLLCQNTLYMVFAPEPGSPGGPDNGSGGPENGSGGPENGSGAPACLGPRGATCSDDGSSVVWCENAENKAYDCSFDGKMCRMIAEEGRAECM